jgi:hypothetical protein
MVPAWPSCTGFEVVAQAAQLRERFARVFREDLAFPRFDQAAGRALEQLGAHDRFDLGERFRHGGLRQRQVLGDPSDMQPFADRNHQLQVPELEVRAEQAAKLSQSRHVWGAASAPL